MDIAVDGLDGRRKGEEKHTSCKSPWNFSPEPMGKHMLNRYQLPCINFSYNRLTVTGHTCHHNCLLTLSMDTLFHSSRLRYHTQTTQYIYVTTLPYNTHTYIYSRQLTQFTRETAFVSSFLYTVSVTFYACGQ